MGKPELPHYKLKQSLLFGKDTKPEELRRLGQKYLEEGWLSDAIDFFQAARDVEGLQELRRRTREEGDVFLFKRSLKAMEATANENEWKELADRALELGKLQFAREAYRLAGDRNALDKIDRLIHPEPDPAVVDTDFEGNNQNPNRE